ncbi:MAG: amidohydrolase family protein [Planctomycetota bacterium]
MNLTKPDPEGDLRQKLLTLAKLPNIWVKVSELSSMSPKGSYPFAETYPYVKRVYESFGPDRLLFGTGYPGSARAAYHRPTLRQEIDLIGAGLPFLAPDDRAKILGNNAAKLWGFQTRT